MDLILGQASSIGESQGCKEKEAGQTHYKNMEMKGLIETGVLTIVKYSI